MTNFSKTTWLILVLVSFLIITGMFAYQWWQTNGELVRQVKENEILTKQINELQKQKEGLEKEIKELKITGETADWKTYRNEEYGYEMKYPEDWTIEEYPKGEIFFLALPLVKEDPGVRPYTIKVKILENPEELSTDQWLTNKINDGTIVPISEISDFTIDNINGKKFIEIEHIPGEDEITGEPMVAEFEHESAYICRNNLVYNLAVLANLPPSYLHFDQILSTFGFIEE